MWPPVQPREGFSGGVQVCSFPGYRAREGEGNVPILSVGEQAPSQAEVPSAQGLMLSAAPAPAAGSTPMLRLRRCP